jgi:hypothetical protein
MDKFKVYFGRGFEIIDAKDMFEVIEILKQRLPIKIEQVQPLPRLPRKPVVATATPAARTAAATPGTPAAATAPAER